MAIFLSAILKDLARWRQDILAMALWLAIPLLIGGIIMSISSGGDGPKPKGILLIADEDDSLLSSLVKGAYTQGELGELLVVETVSNEEGARRIEAGEASGFLLVPVGFQDALLDSEPATLVLKTNPSQTILPGIITGVTEVLLDAGFYVEQLFGDEIRRIRDSAEGETVDDAFVAEVALAVQDKVEAAAPMLFPPILEVTVADPPEQEPGVPFAMLFIPGITLMALMFAANGLAGDYWAEREQGTLRRVVVSPARLAGFIVGKAAAAGVYLMVIGFIVLALGFLHQGISFAHILPAVAWVVLSGVALFAWFGFLQTLAPSRHAAELITSIMLFPLMMVGGSLFPLAALPGWLAELGAKTPNGFMVAELTEEIIRAEAWTIDPFAWLTVMIMAVTGLMLTAWRLHSGFARQSA